MEKEEIFKMMRKIQWKLEGYLQLDHVKDKPHFQREAEAAKKINDRIEKLGTLSVKDIGLFISIVDNVEGDELHDGTGWFDYKLHLSNFFTENGFKIDFDGRRIILNNV